MKLTFTTYHFNLCLLSACVCICGRGLIWCPGLQSQPERRFIAVYVQWQCEVWNVQCEVWKCSVKCAGLLLGELESLRLSSEQGRKQAKVQLRRWKGAKYSRDLIRIWTNTQHTKDRESHWHRCTHIHRHRNMQAHKHRQPNSEIREIWEIVKCFEAPAIVNLGDDKLKLGGRFQQTDYEDTFFSSQSKTFPLD